MVFCYNDIHVDLNEANRRVCPQLITSDPPTVNMTQQIDMVAIRKATEVKSESL